MTASDDAREDLVKQYLASFNERDEETLSEFLAEDVVEHGIHEDLHGVDEILGFLDRHFDIFPDYSGTTEEIAVDGDIVTVRYTVSGTHSEEYRDVEPTGAVVEWTGIAMYRIEDDAIAEIWLEEDRLGMLEQLEAVHPPAHLRI